METIGEYRVGRLLGEGGMGKVFEAEERLSGRKVALKVLRPELARSEPARRLFENEMTVLSRLDHPNIVRCLACAEVSGDLVMALELLEGRTLRNLMLDEGALPWERAVRIAPHLERVPVAASWSGRRAVTPDGLPFVGPAGGIEGLEVIGGLSSIGMITGPGLARRLAARDPGPFMAERLA